MKELPQVCTHSAQITPVMWALIKLSYHAQLPCRSAADGSVVELARHLPQGLQHQGSLQAVYTLVPICLVIHTVPCKQSIICRENQKKATFPFGLLFLGRSHWPALVTATECEFPPVLGIMSMTNSSVDKRVHTSHAQLV